MRTRFGNAGWVVVDGLDLPGPLYVRVRPDANGRLRVVELYLDASANEESPIADGDLHDLPMRQIEAHINAHSELVNDTLDRLGPDLSTLATYYATRFVDMARRVEERHWAALNFASQLPTDQLGGDVPPFARVKARKGPSRGRVREADVEYRLTGGPVDGLTDEFLSNVAWAYAAAVARGERPNKAIAEQTSYSLKTAQRWVFTARQRGIMPPGSHGRAG